MVRKKLQGQVAIITGAGRGIGAATALQLAEAGAAVVLAARSEDQVAAVVADLHRRNLRAIGLAVDVSDPEQVEEVVESALDQFARVDILVNNAAVIWPFEEVAETDADEWVYNIHVNLIGPLYMARNVLPVMLDQRYGRILNITCSAASHPVAGASAYRCAKAGLTVLTRVMAKELAGSGVTINALNPGMVNTEMQADIRSVDTSESTLDTTIWHEAHEQGRLSSPADSARMICWLVGPWNGGENGKVFDACDAQWRARVDEDMGL